MPGRVERRAGCRAVPGKHASGWKKTPMPSVTVTGVKMVFSIYVFVLQTILVGDSGVGKTSLLVQFDQGKFKTGSFSATVGIGFTVS